MNVIRSKLQELHNTSQRVSVTIGSIEDCIKKEESQDLQFRLKHSKYDSTAGTAPSSMLQKDVRESLSKFKSVYEQARQTDVSVLREILGSEAQEVSIMLYYYLSLFL
jgi:hypothetical protein